MLSAAGRLVVCIATLADMILPMDVDGLQRDLGRAVRELRVSKDLTREELANRANVSAGAVKNLELGKGAQTSTLVSVVYALGATAWLTALTPEPEFNPFDVLANASANTASATRRRPRRTRAA